MMVEALIPFLKQGQVWMRPTIDSDSGGVVWLALFEVKVGGVWHQDRGFDADPEVALTQCLQLDGGKGILGTPFSFQPLVDWIEHQQQEEAAVPTGTPARDWHLPTRAQSFKNSRLPLTELLKGIKCRWCSRERELKDLTLDWNLEFICLTETKSCVHPATGQPATQAPGNATFVAAGVPIEGSNGAPPKLPEPVKKTRKSSKSSTANTDIKVGDVGPPQGRVFTCQLEKGGCGKKKRVKTVKGKLPELCSVCRAKKKEG